MSFASPQAVSASLPDERGRFGEFGGRYVPEVLMPAFEELTAAYEALRRGDYTQSVRHSTEAVRQLLLLKPEIVAKRAQAGGRYLPPNVGARLVTENVSEPQVIFDREKFTLSEALTWYEYALESVLIGELE